MPRPFPNLEFAPRVAVERNAYKRGNPPKRFLRLFSLHGL